MKKALSASLALFLLVALLTVPASAEGDHVHVWSEKWSYDDDAHWHDCTAPDCPVTDNSQKNGYGRHTGDWTVTQEAGDRTAGKQHRTCPICGKFQYEITPASLPTSDRFVLDLRSGPVSVSGDDIAALENSLRAIPGAALREMNLMGPLTGYYADLDGDGTRDLSLTLVYKQAGPDEAPNQVSSVICAAEATASLTSFEGTVPADRVAACLEIGQPVFGALAVRLGYEAGDLTDITGHWAEDTIAQAVAEGWVNGYPDGTFQPQGTITRAEMTKLFLAAANQTSKGDAAPQESFTDMDAHWLTVQGWTDLALGAGLLVPSDYPDGAFLPDQAITRGEIAILAARTVGLSPDCPDTENAFTDQAGFSPDQAGYICAVAAAGIIDGYPDGSFGADRTATRAEAVTMVARTINVMREGDNTGLPEGEQIALHLRVQSLPDSFDPIDLSGDCQIVNGLVYADLDVLARHLRTLDPAERETSLIWYPGDQSLTIQMEDSLTVYTAGEIGYTLAGEARTFPAPVRLRNGSLMIPLFDLNAGTVSGPWDVQWDETSRTLTIPAVWPESGGN